MMMMINDYLTLQWMMMIAQDIRYKIGSRYAQALPKVWGFILRKWDKMSPGRVHQLGQYVSGEVHNAVGQFVLGTKCLLTFEFNLLWFNSILIYLGGLIPLISCQHENKTRNFVKKLPH